MPIVLFNFARNLKITRFTIDVLTQRLEHLESPRDGTSEEWSRFVGLTHESVAAIDHVDDILDVVAHVVTVAAIVESLELGRDEVAVIRRMEVPSGNWAMTDASIASAYHRLAKLKTPSREAMTSTLRLP